MSSFLVDVEYESNMPLLILAGDDAVGEIFDSSLSEMDAADGIVISA